MSQDLANRKTIELKQKLANLVTEFDYWIERSNEGKRFEKHQSQIAAVTTILKTLQEGAITRLAAATTTEEKLAVGRRAERMTLATHRIWEFFRSKFAQRKEARLACYLFAADEFAWECYKPVRDVAAANHPAGFRKEPPLVFFNGGLSPFSISRDRAFEGEPVPNELLSGPEFSRVLSALPIPVVGVPWHQVSHLPDALVIGHEVGHTIEDDFGLTEHLERQLQQALETGGVEAAHFEAWQSWRGEMFADVYGCLATGPAFVSSLMDFLVRDPNEVAEERPVGTNFGRYPTTQLRMLVNLEALSQIGFKEAAKVLDSNWRGYYPSHQLAAFEPDVKKVVAALLNATYPQLANRSVMQIFRFSPDHQEEAKRAVRQIRIDRSLENSTDDFRVLFAAARLAYAEAPADFVKDGHAEMILKRIGQLIKPGTRSFEAQLTDEQKKKLSGDHLRMGERILDDLWKLTHA
jgi:hypothetical protein